MKPIIISERISELEKELKSVIGFIEKSQFQPEEKVFARMKSIEMELFELSDMQGRGQKYIWMGWGKGGKINV